MIRHLIALSLLAACATPAFAQDGAGAEPKVTRPPQLLEGAEPEYPAEARAERREGVVVLEIEISATGEVTDVQVQNGAGHGFDEAATAAARRLRFSPAEIDGKPAPVRIEYRFTFSVRPSAPVEPAAETGRDGGVADALVAQPEPPRVVNLRGIILERGSKKPLGGAVIEVGDALASVTSDDSGAFEVPNLPAGTVRVVVAAADHERFETSETIEAGKQTVVKYYVRAGARSGYQAFVVGQREKKEVAQIALSVGEITQVAGSNGDAVKVVQNLPGVARVSPFSGALVVRGGNPLDTRVYIDGVEAPLIFHFGGLTSVYPSELAKEVAFEPGNFSVRFGRATAGRIELKTRDPNPERLHLVARADFIDALAMAEGPVSQNVSVAAAVRRSYVGTLLDFAMSQSADAPSFVVVPRYYDFQTKLTWRASPKTTVRFGAYGSDDRMGMAGLEDPTVEKWDKLDVGLRFLTLTGNVEHRFTPRTRGYLSLASRTLEQRQTMGPLLMRLRGSTLDVRAELEHDFGDRLRLAGGIDTMISPWIPVEVTMPQIPGANQLGQLGNGQYTRWQETLRSYDPAAWLEARIKPVDSLVIVPGVRADYGSYMHAAWVDPRLAVRWQARTATTLKLGLGRYHQLPQVGYATKGWGNPALKEEASTQLAGGGEQKLFGPLSLDVELYYKWLDHLALPSARTIVRDGELVPERYANAGTGRAYGAELLLRYAPDGRFFGWIAYSLSRTERDQNVVGGFPGTNGDEYDQPHNLIVVGSLALPELWRGLQVGARARYVTGSRYRPMVAAVYDADADMYQGIPSARMDQRLPAFFQLDVRFDKQWVFKTWSLSAYLDLQNATNRTNAEGVQWSHDMSQRAYIRGLPIYPSLGLRFEY